MELPSASPLSSIRRYHPTAGLPRPPQVAAITIGLLDSGMINHHPSHSHMFSPQKLLAQASQGGRVAPGGSDWHARSGPALKVAKGITPLRNHACRCPLGMLQPHWPPGLVYLFLGAGCRKGGHAWAEESHVTSLTWFLAGLRILGSLGS